MIKGKSQKPVYLWIHDGVADISDAKEVWGKDVWASTDAIRELMGDQPDPSPDHWKGGGV